MRSWSRRSRSWKACARSWRNWVDPKTRANSLIVPKGKLTQAGLEYVRKLRDVKYYETIFDILARQFEIAKLDEAREGAMVQVVDPAVPPDRRSFPKRGLITAHCHGCGIFPRRCGGFLSGGLERA